MPAESPRTCPTCSTLIPASFPQGFCPKCMLASATPADDKTVAVPAPTPSHSTRPGGVPSLETLRGLFPELEILSLLGAGGMGAVYKARQPRLNRLIALKIMVAAPGHEADFALRFEREAQVLARLNHPHIVTLYDFGELGPERTRADPLFYFLMEYVDGTDLGQLIRAKELKPAQSLVIVPQICEALQYAHDQGITHRDIKPANILIDKRGTVKIADFGLAKMITGSAEDALMTGLTQTGTAMGTPHYMAPEQWDHPEQVDHRADIYALGVVFYEMLTGERPAGVFEPPSKKSTPPVDKKLDSVVMRAMDKNPARRYQQAGQIGDDVTRITRITGVQKSTRRPYTPLLALGAVAALAVGGWTLWPGDKRELPLPVSPSSSTPGLLRAAGTTANGQSHDLSKFAVYDDFIDVAGGWGSWGRWGRWVALRANGDTVSSDGKTDLRGIRRIARSFNAEYGFIDTQGKLHLHPDSTIVLPAVLDTVQVVDAAPSFDHGLALLSDQTVVTLGPRYEGTVGNPDDPKGYGTPRWPPPPAEALREVASIAITATHAATLRLDGTVTLWGWEGRVVWAAEPRLKRVRQLVSSEESLWMLDDAGQVWRFPLPRNPSPQQPVFSDGRLKLTASGATTVRERSWRLADGTWRSDMPEASTHLQALRLPDTAAIALNIGNFQGKDFVSLLWIEPPGAPSATSSKQAPLVNSLGMKFLPVPITGGPTDGQRVLFSIWETRVQDFEAFARSEKLAWLTEGGLTPGPTHPAVKVTWTEAQAFCIWLTQQEQKAGTLAADERYRLPTDHEWSCAVGLGTREDAALAPAKKHLAQTGVYPWGSTWPPPERAGNYASEELRPLLAEGRYSYIREVITGYQDGQSESAPVGFYPPNALGLHDLGGNVLEWCEDWFDTSQSGRVNRGSGAWSDYRPENLQSAHRGTMEPEGKVSALGFRIVRVGE